ncbi:MAG: TraB/GumN family protein [Bacteroidales bacterium]|nr:TraB/GumN family protein [Bacteroidales bacterium]
MRKTLLLAFLLLGLMLGHSQSLLWKVSGNGLDKPSYLYGSIHIQDNRVFSFDTTVITTLLSCEAFAMEILMDEIDPKTLKNSMYMPKGKLLSDMMSTEDFAKLDSICKKDVGVSAYLMNTMKPFFVSSAITQSKIAQDQQDALDIFLLKKAREAGKLCYGVEKYETQIAAIDAISLKEQLKMLSSSLNGTEEETEQFDDLLNAYLSFNLDTMLILSNDPSMPKKFNKVFLIDRNVGMADNFEKIAREHTLFCVVGAAHLGGTKGVIALLRKKALP